VAKADVLARVRAKLGHFTLEPRPVLYLDTGFQDLNEVLGHRDHGMYYGKITEVSGWNSAGKSALGAAIAAMGHLQGALVIWLDVENSFDPVWSKQRGMEVEVDEKGRVKVTDKLILIQPYVGTFKDEKKPRLTSAQDLCEEVEQVLAALTDEEGRIKNERIILVVDSVAALLTEGEAEAGITGQTMRTNFDLPVFLGRLLRRWTGLAQAHNMMVVLLNQLRQKPMVFGDPSYSVGGNAVPFYCHVRVRMRRAKGGLIKRKGKTVGVQGIIDNTKNKTGGRERVAVGFKLYFDGPLEFLEASDLEKDDE
jgi:recombination protein RecA